MFVTGQTSVQKPKLSKQRFLTTKADGLISALDGLPVNEWSEDDRNDVFLHRIVESDALEQDLLLLQGG